MRHENSVFHQLTQYIPWKQFDRLVDKHGSDFRVRRLDSKSQFLALLFGQLAGATSLREIAAGLGSHQSRLYHCSAKPIARSTLSDANAKRPWILFADLFGHMPVTASHCQSLPATASRSTRRSLSEAVRILDATTIRLSGLTIDWSLSRSNRSAVKLHVVYDPNKDVTCTAVVTAENVNDITPARQLKIESGATYTTGP